MKNTLVDLTRTLCCVPRRFRAATPGLRRASSGSRAMPRRNSYTPEQLAWLAERSGTMLRSELAEAFNKRFGQARSVKAITSTINRERLPQRAPGHPKGHNIKLFTPEQICFIRQAYLSMQLKEVLRILNEWWGSEFTERQLYAFVKNHKIHSGRTGKFEKGHTVQKRNPTPTGPGPGRFKPGRPAHEARNYVPIGTVRFTADGYMVRKVTDDPSVVPARRWVHEHRLIWEAAYGPIPDGHVVVFLDGRPLNLALDNLRCVPRGVLARLNYKGKLAGLNGEARKAAILACELEQMAVDRRKTA